MRGYFEAPDVDATDDDTFEETASTVTLGPTTGASGGFDDGGGDDPD